MDRRMESEDAYRAWLKVLDPRRLGADLTSSAVALLAYELLLEGLVLQPRGFFADTYDDEGPVVSASYKEPVLSLHKTEYFACAHWFKRLGAIDEADIVKLNEIRRKRNFIAHNIPELIGRENEKSRAELITAAASMLSKIDKWWIRNIEIPASGEADDAVRTDASDAEAFSMRMLIMEFALDLVSNDGRWLASVHEEFAERGRARGYEAGSSADNGTAEGLHEERPEK